MYLFNLTKQLINMNYIIVPSFFNRAHNETKLFIKSTKYLIFFFIYTLKFTFEIKSSILIPTKLTTLVF